MKLTGTVVGTSRYRRMAEVFGLTAHEQLIGGVADSVPGLVGLGRGAGDLRVGAADLGQGIKLAGTSRWLCWVGAEQRERVLDAQLIPQRLELDGGIDQAGFQSSATISPKTLIGCLAWVGWRSMELITCQKPAGSGQSATMKPRIVSLASAAR